jgi:hypothetical protein
VLGHAVGVQRLVGEGRVAHEESAAGHVGRDVLVRVLALRQPLPRLSDNSRY